MFRGVREPRRPTPPGVRWAEWAGGDDARARLARIAVVGAGASGVATARALAERGFTEVTVLEREDRVGGKCWTVEHGGRTYELGAGAMTSRYGHVRRWLREAGQRATFKYSGLFLDPESGRQTFTPPPFAGGGWLRAPLHLARMYRELARYPGIDDPGLDGMPPALFRPATELVRDAGMEVMAGFGEPFFTGFGYGRYEETPALYVMKYAALFGPVFELLPEGFGGLVRSMARDLDVRLGVGVERIERSNDRVRLHTTCGTMDFDALVLTTPLDQAPDVLDASPAERELFGRIRHNPYYVLGARVEGLPNARYTFFPRHFARSHEGKPVFVYRRWGAEGLALFYGYHREGEEHRIEDQVRETVERVGGRVREVFFRRCWRYFPHVTAEDLEDGFYAKVEALQGRRRTYFGGETLAFGTVETCVRYGKDLVERFFAPAHAEGPSRPTW